MIHTSIHLSHLRNAEYIQYLKDYLTILTNNNTTDLSIVSQHTALSAKVVQIEDVFKQDQSSALTLEIADLDRLRDQYLVGLYTTINGLCSHPTDATRGAALALADRLAVYGTATQIGNQALQGQTTTVSNLITDLETITTLTTALATLALTSWVAELKTTNNALNAKYIARTEELAAINPDRIKELRFEGNALYYQLRDMLMAQALVAGYIDPFPRAINEVNALTEQYVQTLATRAGRLAADDTDPPAPPEA